eukprot:SAG31_NODE_2498_length_5598_cov_2.801600_9_plen_110_part_00
MAKFTRSASEQAERIEKESQVWDRHALRNEESAPVPEPKPRKVTAGAEQHVLCRTRSSQNRREKKAWDDLFARMDKFRVSWCSVRALGLEKAIYGKRSYFLVFVQLLQP